MEFVLVVGALQVDIYIVRIPLQVYIKTIKTVFKYDRYLILFLISPRRLS